MHFPITRLRRLRKSASIRALVCETRLHPADFVAPLFVVPGKGIKKAISSLPQQFQLSTDLAVEQSQKLLEAGLKSVLLFGIPREKDENGSSALKDDGVIQETIRAIKKNSPELTVITDLCFCEYTSHGHCGVLKGDRLANDETLELLAKQALSHANAGVDIIAPSGMLDGCVRAIRSALDERKYTDTLIMGYSSKFVSAFYGPFRDAVNSSPKFGDRRGYQMNPANTNEALREISADIKEGADIVMIKPAMAYLDIIMAAKEKFKMPTAAYNVSGEYAMIKLAAQNGIIDGEKIMYETLLSIKRAGADIIISYFSEEFAALFNSGKIEDFI